MVIQVILFTILDPCILRIYKNCLNSMGKVNPEPDHIVNLPTLLSGSTLSQFSEQTTTPTALSCISYICLSLKGELFCSQLLSVL